MYVSSDSGFRSSGFRVSGFRVYRAGELKLIRPHASLAVGARVVPGFHVPRPPHIYKVHACTKSGTRGAGTGEALAGSSVREYFDGGLFPVRVSLVTHPLAYLNLKPILQLQFFFSAWGASAEQTECRVLAIAVSAAPSSKKSSERNLGPCVLCRCFLGQGRFSLADLALAPWYYRFPIVLGSYRGFAVPETAEYARLHEWWRQVCARESFQRTLVSADRLVHNYREYADGSATSEVACTLAGAKGAK